AREALRAGGAKPALLNAANEVAVAAFLEGRIGFLDIASIAAESLQCCDQPAPASIEEVLEIDREARAAAATIGRRYSR
ncbi:MAG TPA: 1-deoxy-D-xylulose-5-phosphate reductoisomerase, partial [Allosphingosinicella sp.]